MARSHSRRARRSSKEFGELFCRLKYCGNLWNNDVVHRLSGEEMERGVNQSAVEACESRRDENVEDMRNVFAEMTF